MMHLRLVFFLVILFSISCSSKLRFAQKDRPARMDILTHTYSDVIQDTECEDEPIVRFVSFSFEKRDSLNVSIDITTSLAEQNISGVLNILLDEYDLEYGNIPTSKKYEETLEVEIESQSRYPTLYRGNFNLVNAILRSTIRKGTRKEKSDQYWNSVRITIEPEDETLLMKSKSIRYKIETVNCDINIYPSISQIVELRKFLN